MEAGLSVHWIVVGPSGNRFRPEEGGVLQHYDQCIPEPSTLIKTIVNTYYLRGITVHPHNFEYQCVHALPAHAWAGCDAQQVTLPTLCNRCSKAT